MPTFNLSQLLKWSAILVFVGLIVLLPSLHFMPSYLTYHDGHRLLMLLLLVLTLLYSLSNKQNFCNQLIIDAKLRYMLFILFALACISSYLAIAPRHAIIEVSIFIGLAYLALFVSELYYQEGTIFTKRLIFALWVGVLLYLFAFYVGYITACVFKTPVAWPKPLLGFNNPRFFNQYQLWSIGLLCLPLLVTETSKNAKRGLGIALTLWWVLLFYSASRGVVLAWLAGAVLTWALYKELAWPFLRLQILSFITGLISYFILFELVPILINMELVTGTILRESSSNRVELWVKAFQLTWDNPLFGVGPMGFAWYNSTSFHPHNTIMQLTSEWGLPATLVCFWIAVYTMKKWFKKFNLVELKNKTKYDVDLSIILFFTIVTNGLYSLVDGVVVMPMSQIFMATIIGLMIGQYLSFTDSPAGLKNRLGFRPIFSLVVIISLIWSNLPEIKQGLSGYELGFSTGPGKTNPRIWINIRTT